MLVTEPVSEVALDKNDDTLRGEVGALVVLLLFRFNVVGVVFSGGGPEYKLAG